jgi:hypothetical protein
MSDSKVFFASCLTKKNRFYSNPGSREANDCIVDINDKGHKTLIPNGTHDIYQEIQSYAEECKIENIIARAAAGDTAALNQRQGMYGDFTNTPKNLAEAQNIILKLSAEFDSLPIEIKKKFDNSKEKYVQEFGSENWAAIMGLKTKESEPEKTENVDFVPGTTEAAKDVLTPEGASNE